MTEPSWPSYLALHESGELVRRAEEAVESLASCAVCPRNCGVNRLEDQAQVCNTGRLARVSSYFPHLGEEDCLRGWSGSGTIFFSLCNLRCVFCQNWDISQAGAGSRGRARRARRHDARAAASGLPQHQLRHARARRAAGARGVAAGGRRAGCACRSSTTPAPTTRWRAWSCSTASSTSTCPTSSSGSRRRAQRFLKAKDYPEVARAAIREMHRQVGALEFDARRPGPPRRAGAPPGDARARWRRARRSSAGWPTSSRPTPT